MSYPRTLVAVRGFLAVADPWRGDYDTPRRVRIVWVSRVALTGRENLIGSRVEAGGTSGDVQGWAIYAAVSYSRDGVPISTPLAGEVEWGEAIAAPRKRKGQARPWRYERGEWVCHRPSD